MGRRALCEVGRLSHRPCRLALRLPPQSRTAVCAVRRARHGEGVIPELRVDFYGPMPGNLLELARRHGVDSFTITASLREDVMREERSASLFLIIQNNDPRTSSEYGSKIFEYQAAGPLVLALGPQAGVLRSYISQNQLRWFASSEEEIRNALCARIVSVEGRIACVTRLRASAPLDRSRPRSPERWEKQRPTVRFRDESRRSLPAWPRTIQPACDSRADPRAGRRRERAKSGFSFCR